MTRTVYVYRHEYGTSSGGVKAYTLTYLTEQTSGACIHEVEASTSNEAKRLAKYEHRERCADRVTRPWCGR